MEKIIELIDKIQGHLKQNEFNAKLRQETLESMRKLVKKTFPHVYTKKGVLLNDLDALNQNLNKVINEEGTFVNNYSSDFSHFKWFLEALQMDYELKRFINIHKNSRDIDSTQLKCYELIARLYTHSFYYWSCKGHYVHRSEIEKIATFLESKTNLLIEKFDIGYDVERQTKYNLENRPDSYHFRFNELIVSVFMSGDGVNHMSLNPMDHTPVFSFLRSIKKEIGFGLDKLIHKLFWRASVDKNKTALFSDLSHDDLIEFLKSKYCQKDLRSIHNFRDESSTDLILNEMGYKIGIQIECNADIKNATKSHTFTKAIKAQIQDARRIPHLDKYVILFCIDLTKGNYDSRLNMTKAQLEQMNDDFFVYYPPENLVELFSKEQN